VRLFLLIENLGTGWLSSVHHGGGAWGSKNFPTLLIHGFELTGAWHAWGWTKLHLVATGSYRRCVWSCTALLLILFITVILLANLLTRACAWVWIMEHLVIMLLESMHLFNFLFEIIILLLQSQALLLVVSNLLLKHDTVIVLRMVLNLELLVLFHELLILFIYFLGHARHRFQSLFIWFVLIGGLIIALAFLVSFPEVFLVLCKLLIKAFP